jgi:hypothetical protein
MAGMLNMPAPAPKPAQGQEQPQEQGEGASERDPAYDAAIKLAMDALYGAEAARDVAQAIRSAQDPVEALANTAYEMVQVVDERTEGQVPDELLVALASEVLGEVVEIAQAAGVQVGGREIAEAMRAMILRFVAEQGGDISQLQQAMGQIDTSELGALMDKAQAGEAKAQ